MRGDKSFGLGGVGMAGAVVRRGLSCPGWGWIVVWVVTAWDAVGQGRVVGTGRAVLGGGGVPRVVIWVGSGRLAGCRAGLAREVGMDSRLGKGGPGRHA